MISQAKTGMRHPGRSRLGTAMVLGCLGVSLLFVIFQGGKLALMIFVMTLVLSLYLFLGRWSGITRVNGQRMLGLGREEGIEAGTALRVKVVLHIPGFWPVPYVLLRDRLLRKNGGGQDFEAFFIPDWSRVGEVEYYTPPLARGFYQFGHTQCSTQDIFGIFEHSGAIDLPLSFTVLPRTVPIKEWQQLHRVFKGMRHHAATTASHRETTQINGVREYSYGDRLSRIHWNATARTGMLKSKEFEREALPGIVVFLDRQRQGYSSPEQFELAVSIAASLIQYGKNREINLGLLSVGSASSYESPSRQGGTKAMMHHLIEVSADGVHSLQRILEDRLKLLAPGTCVVIVSPLKGAPVLKAIAWLGLRQMLACHIYVTSRPAEGGAWCRELQAMGHMGYAIRNLDELPDALRGVAYG